MKLKDLLLQRATLENEVQNLRESIAGINEQIDEMLSQRLVDLRQVQGKEFGAVNMVFEGYKVTETITKKVDWDQEKLLGLFEKIMAAGDRPGDYMRMKLDVPEKMYGAFPDPIKAIFAEARTVKGERPKLTFEEVTNA